MHKPKLCFFTSRASRARPLTWLIRPALFATVLLAITAMLAPTGSAQGTDSLKWHLLSESATPSTVASGGDYRIEYSLTQTAVNAATGGSYELTGGFWSPCCIEPMRGDCNYNGTGPNIVDHTFLVGCLFSNGPCPACFDEGDLNADGAINIVDLTYMSGYLFGGGPPPKPCP